MSTIRYFVTIKRFFILYLTTNFQLYIGITSVRIIITRSDQSNLYNFIVPKPPIIFSRPLNTAIAHIIIITVDHHAVTQLDIMIGDDGYTKFIIMSIKRMISYKYIQ